MIPFPFGGFRCAELVPQALLAPRRSVAVCSGMPIDGLRSPYAKVGPIVYFGRMLDKIRLHAGGNLPADYQANLGEGFDKFCVELLGVSYPDLVVESSKGGSDEDLLAWCGVHGRNLTEQDFIVWNEFMRKRGWNDTASERLSQRKAESGFPQRDDIQTFFDYIDADEGRK